MRYKNKNGYTLIELLIIVFIIGLIASVAIVEFNQSRARARDAKLLNNAYVLQKALTMYYEDHGEYPPHTPDAGFSGLERYTAIKGDDTEDVFKNAMKPYLKKLPDDGNALGKGKFNNWSPMPRLSYRRLTNFSDWAVDFWTNRGYSLGKDCQNKNKECYALQLYTETKTALGPADTGIYLFSNGEKWNQGWMWLIF